MAKKIIKINESRLMDIINRTVNEVVSSRGQLVEGVQYNKEENSFIFDFVHDSERDIIKLTNSGLTKSEINNKCFYFKYQFEGNVSSQLRAKFIEHMKFHEGMNKTDIETFVKSAVNSLDDTVNLREYNTVIYPQSISEINRKVITYIRKFGYPNFLSFELVKEPPTELRFDYESYHREILDATHRIGNREFPRYSEAQKAEEERKIKELMKFLKGKDYVSIGRDVSLKYRPYIHNFYKFENEEQKQVFIKMNQPKVLIIDDVMTSGTTLTHIINTIYKVNPNATVIVFAILGKS